jgi:hypothetical protein
MINQFLKLPVLLLVLILLPVHVRSQDNFFAYHTKLSHTSTDYFGKYADLIVSFGKGKQLEFTRQTNYVPRWKTPSGVYLIDEFFPGRDMDYDFDYNWSNEELNVTLIEGFTSAVHELFTIYPDGHVERLVKNANGTTFRDWNNPGFGHKQEIQLKDDGIIHGSVDWGELQEESIKKIEKSLIIDRAGLPVPSVSLTFDEGGGDYPDMDFEEEEWEEVLEEMKDHVVDFINLEFAPISGHGAVYKKGVSGTSLAFDGYYTGIKYEEDLELEQSMTLEAWIALDVFPYNDAPIIQRSERFGKNGFYLGIDAYGNPFIKVNDAMAKSEEPIPLYSWTHISASIGEGIATLYINGQQINDVEFNGDILPDDVELSFGLNTEKERCTDYVRDLPQNLPFIYGIQGLMDEVKM